MDDLQVADFLAACVCRNGQRIHDHVPIDGFGRGSTSASSEDSTTTCPVPFCSCWIRIRSIDVFKLLIRGLFFGQFFGVWTDGDMRKRFWGTRFAFLFEVEHASLGNALWILCSRNLGRVVGRTKVWGLRYITQGFVLTDSCVAGHTDY